MDKSNFKLVKEFHVKENILDSYESLSSSLKLMMTDTFNLAKALNLRGVWGETAMQLFAQNEVKVHSENNGATLEVSSGQRGDVRVKVTGVPYYDKLAVLGALVDIETAKCLVANNLELSDVFNEAFRDTFSQLAERREVCLAKLITTPVRPTEETVPGSFVNSREDPFYFETISEEELEKVKGEVKIYEEKYEVCQIVNKALDSLLHTLNVDFPTICETIRNKSQGTKYKFTHVPSDKILEAGVIKDGDFILDPEDENHCWWVRDLEGVLYVDSGESLVGLISSLLDDVSRTIPLLDRIIKVRKVK